MPSAGSSSYLLLAFVVVGRSAGQLVPGSACPLVFQRLRSYFLFVAVPATAMGKRLPASPTVPGGPMKLDAKTVSVLVMPPGKTDHITRDSDLPGFGYRLRLGAGGKMLRSWIVQYRRASTTRRLLLGSAGVLGAEAARTAAKKALAKVALGEDPRP